jgi:PKD repeat protein
MLASQFGREISQNGGTVRALHAARSRIVVGLLSLSAAIALSAGASPAGAVVAKLGGHGYGIAPRNGAAEASLVSAFRAERSSHHARARAGGFDEAPFGGSELESEGGPVMHSVVTHVVYWDPPTSQFTSTTKGIVNGFFSDVGHDSGLPTNVFAIAGQYTDSTGNAAYSSTATTPLLDSHAYPTSGNCTVPNEADKGPFATCLFDEQLQVELKSFIEEEELPTGPTQLYFMLLPHNVATCLPETIGGKQVCSNNFFCAYHSFIEPGTANEIIYADIPFSLLDTSFAKGCQADGNSAIQLPNGDKGTSNTETRFADVALKYISHEYIEAVTDPLVNFDTAWVDVEGLEIGDKCNGIPFTPEEEGEPGFDKNAFTPTLGGTAGAGTLFNQAIDGGSFYLQSEWDNAAEACLMKPLALSSASFTTAPTSGLVGSAVSFKGVATDPYAGLGFTWRFGDGTEGTGASPAHTYAAPGSYEVTMTPKDALTGSTATPVVHTVVINDVPTASFTVSPNPATEGEPVGFDGEASKDEDGAIVAYAWKFGDGATGSGAKPTHVYAGGTYTVTLTVTDSGEQTATTTRSLTVHGAPTAVTGQASSVGQTAAQLNASVNPNGNATACSFQYGPTVSYGSSAPCAPSPGSGTSAVATSAAITGLSPGTTYHFRVVAESPSGTRAGADEAFATQATPSTMTPPTNQPTVSLPPVLIPPPTPTSAFASPHVAVNVKTGALTLTTSVTDPGALRWLATFPNGKFGAFASSSRCKTGTIRLAGKCRPAKIVFAKGSKAVAGAGAVSFTLKPSASAAKALKNALRKGRGVPVSVALTFQSSRGGSPVTHVLSLTVKLKK